MSPRHHPPQALLLDHATGALDMGSRLVIRAHLGACPACLADVALAETIGGALLAGADPVALKADALDHALARIERPFAAVPPSPPNPDWIAVPSVVLDAARRRRRWAAPGVWVAPVSKDASGVSTYLLRVGAGMSVPLHTHRGAEMVCVLEGAYTDGETLHDVGDFAFNDASILHRPRVTRTGACVCLIAAHGALVPRDWVGHLFQPFVRI